MSIFGNPLTFGGGKGADVINLLDGVTWIDGYYLDSGGNPQPAGSGSFDFYSDTYIDISDSYNSTFIAVTKSSVNSEPWIGLCFYNGSKSHVTRQTSTNKILLQDGFYYNWLVYHPTNTNIRYVRFSTRSYANDMDILLTSIDKLPLLLKPYVAGS